MRDLDRRRSPGYPPAPGMNVPRSPSIAVLLSLTGLLLVVPPSFAADDGLDDVKMPRLRDALRESEVLAQAWFRLRAGDVVGARRDLQAFVREEPRDPDALHLYGLAAAAAGKRHQAQRVLAKSLRIRPDGWVALHLVNLHLDAARLRAATRVIAKQGNFLDDDPELLLARAYLHVAEEDFAAARAIFEDLEERQRSAASAAQLAVVLMASGEAEEAAGALGQAVERAPEDAGLRRRYLEALVRAEDWETLHREAGEEDVGVVNSGLQFYYQGVAALNLGERDDGIDAMMKLVEHPRAEAAGLAGAAGLLFEADAWEESEAALRALLRHRPDEATVHHLLAMSLSRLHRESEALAHYRQASALKKKNADLAFDLMSSLCELDLIDELEDRLRRALRDFDEDPRFPSLASQCLPAEDG